MANEDKRRVGVITPAKFPGTSGDTANYTEIMNELISAGTDVVLICPKNPVSTNETLVTFSFTLARIPCSPPRLQQIKSGFSIRHYFAALAFMLAETITVLRILRKYKIKFVFIRHSILTIHLPILLKLIRVRSIADGEIVSDYFKHIHTNPIILRILQSYEKRVIKYYSYFKVSSKSQVENLQNIGFPKERILIIPVSVNIDKIPRFRLEDIPEHTFGYFGVLESWQGVDILLEAFQLVLKKLPSARLFVIGNGSMEENLKKMVHENNLTSSVVFVGSVPRDELFRDLFKQFRVVVIPRPRQNDSIDFIMPIKLIESLAAGKPTVAMDIPVMREVIGNPVLLAISEDPQVLADTLVKLSSNGDMLNKYSAAGLASVANYDVKTNMKKLIHKLFGDS